MEMHEIRYFLAVCDTLNFTRAAERCNVSQPSLTRAIQKLEAELGGLLFRRERAATHLTADAATDSACNKIAGGAQVKLRRCFPRRSTSHCACDQIDQNLFHSRLPMSAQPLAS